MSVRDDAQTRLDERLLERGDLEEALEEREKRRKSAGELRRQFKEADDRAKALLAEFDLQDGEVARCGRFRIVKSRSEGRTVAFETSPSSRIRIQADSEDL